MFQRYIMVINYFTFFQLFRKRAKRWLDTSVSGSSSIVGELFFVLDLNVGTKVAKKLYQVIKLNGLTMFTNILIFPRFIDHLH